MESSKRKRRNKESAGASMRPRRELQSALEYDEAILATIREPLIVLDASLRIVSANESFYKSFLVKPEETEGKLIYDIGNRQWDIPKLRELLEEILPKNTSFNDFEVDHEFPKLGRRKMLLNARRLHDGGQKTGKILLAIEDITERKRLEYEMVSSELRYRRLFETAQDGILILDAETGQITDVNPFLIKMLGYLKNEFLGKTLWEISPFKDIKAGKTAFLELQTKGYIRYSDLPLETKDGRSIAVEFVSNIYQVNGQKVIQCNIRDITARSKTEHELRERVKELQCLYGISRVLEKPELSQDEILQEIVNLIPPGMQYPEITSARILFRDKTFATNNYRPTEWILKSDIKVHDIKTGAVEISYLEQKPEIDEGPFLKEERLLINAITERLGKVIERTQAEKDLEAERTRLVSVLDGMEDGIYIVNQNYDIEYVNPVLEREFGKVEGRKCYSYFDDREEVCPWCKNEEIFAGKTVRWEWYSSKNQRTYDLIDTPFNKPDGSMSKLEIFRDITERKQAEQALKESEQLLHESEQRLHLAQDAANAGTWEWDLRTNKNYWSEEIWKLYGLAPHICEPSYDAWAQTIHPDDRPNVEKAVREAANNGTRLSTEWRVIGNPGNERWLMSVGQPVLDASGKAVRYIGIVIDISERKKSEQMKDDFIGLVSHELKTPITVIMGSINTALSEGISKEEAKELLEDAASSTGSLATMIDNLLELSRAQANRLMIRKEPVDIAQTARGVVDELKSRSDIHHLIVDVPEKLPLVPADLLCVERILNNLIENAIKYSPHGGDVTIFAQQKDDFIIVGVKDQGVGISRDDQARLFEPFERLGTVSGIAGTGLGLNLCRRLVEAHGGSIWIESEPDQGATFFFTLPLVEAPAT